MSGFGPKLDVFEELQRANADLMARAEELGVEIVRLRALIDSDEDKPLSEDEVIREAHPLRTGRHDLYREALRMVGARHSKGGLVDLVTWLLHRDAEHSPNPLTRNDVEHTFKLGYRTGYSQALVDVEGWLRGMRRTSAAFFVDQLANALKTGSWKEAPKLEKA